MSRIIAILALLTVSAIGQTTYEPYVRIQDLPGQSTSNVWVLAWSERGTSAPWWHWYEERGGQVPSLPLPVLVDMDTKDQVQITNGNAQARQDLTGKDEVRRPAKKALKQYLNGQTRKAKRQELRAAINAATTVPQLRKALKDLDEYRELIEDADNERAGKQAE